MFKKKRVAAVLLCATICLTSMAAQVQAAETSQFVGKEIVMRMTQINDADCHLSIKDGTATVNAFVRGYTATTTKCEIVVKLQVKEGSTWRNVATWSDEQDSYRASVYETKTVTSGKTYRVYTTVTVWDSNGSESKNLISDTVVA